MTSSADRPVLTRWVLAVVCLLTVGALMVTSAPESVVHADRDVRQLQRDFNDAKRNQQASAMVRAANALGDTNDEAAARFLLGELVADQQNRARNRGGLPGNVRSTIIENLGKFTDEGAVGRIGKHATDMDSMRTPVLALDQYDFFAALARMQGVESAEASLREALSDRRNPYVKVAAMEAIRRAEAKQFIPDIVEVLKDNNRLWIEWTIVPINAFDALRTLVQPEDTESVIMAVEATIEWEERKAVNCERTKFFGTRMLNQITGEPANITSLHFWKWWVAQVKARASTKGSDRPADRQSKTAVAPPVFDTEIIGKRHVFVIDVSDSMRWPLRIDLDEIQRRRERREGPATGRPGRGEAERKEEREKDPLSELPWETIKTRLDLAREELSRAIRSLPPGLKFAVVVYSTNVRVLTGGYVDSTPANTTRWAREVRELELEAMTNIHGALMQALRINERNMDTEHPSVDRDCVLTGADTIVFMTDGWGTWDDQSVGRVDDPRNNVPNSIGDGPYIMGDDIWPDILRHNMFRKVIINTIGIGNHDKQLMQKLARETGGVYVDWSFPD